MSHDENGGGQSTNDGRVGDKGRALDRPWPRRDDCVKKGLGKIGLFDTRRKKMLQRRARTARELL